MTAAAPNLPDAHPADEVERILAAQVSLATAGRVDQAIDMMPQLSTAITLAGDAATPVPAATAQRIRALHEHLVLAISCEKQAVGDELRKLLEARKIADSYGTSEAS